MSNEIGVVRCNTKLLYFDSLLNVHSHLAEHWYGDCERSYGCHRPMETSENYSKKLFKNNLNVQKSKRVKTKLIR